MRPERAVLTVDAQCVRSRQKPAPACSTEGSMAGHMRQTQGDRSCRQPALAGELGAPEWALLGLVTLGLTHVI